MHTLRTLTVAGLVTMTALAGTTAPAQARSDDDRIERHGACTGTADWKLKAKSDDGRIEVEGEIDSNKNGQLWRWRIKHNGTVSARGQRQTTGRSGSFSVERKMVNLSGKDRFVFRAVHPASGQVCRGTVTF